MRRLGPKKWDLAHAPYGEVYALAGGGAEFTFTGQFSDYGSTNTLWDFPTREYHSSQGRWISPDPAGLAAADPTNPQTWNRYGYVANTPLNSVDAMGLLRTPWGGFPDVVFGGSWNGLAMIMGIWQCEPNGDCGTVTPINGLAFLLWWSGRYAYLPTNLNNALWNALKALRQKQLSQTCVNKVLKPLGISQQQFQNFLNQNPQFYNGTSSTVPIYGNAVQKGFFNWITTPGTTVAQNFGPGTMAMTLPGAANLVTFVAPQAIDTSGFGANVANESMLFHEALHGISGVDQDISLQSILLGPTGVDENSSMNITDFIVDQCF